MSIHEMLGLRPTPDPCRWKLHVGDGIVTGGGALQGGAGLGAVLEAMIAVTKRPPVWATAQFISHAAPHRTLDLRVDLVLEGHKVTQARARLADGDQEVLQAVAAFGTRDSAADHTFCAPPAVPAPEACPIRPEPTLHGWEARRALGRGREGLDGRPGSGRSASWYRRPVGMAEVSAGELPMVGDCCVLELSDALGFPCLGSSLDNTLRIASSAPTEWILLDASVSNVARGFAAVTAHLWSQDETLLGVFSQTLVVRRVDAEGRAIRTTKRYAGS